MVYVGSTAHIFFPRLLYLIGTQCHYTCQDLITFLSGGGGGGGISASNNANITIAHNVYNSKGDIIIMFRYS